MRDFAITLAVVLARSRAIMPRILLVLKVFSW